MKKIWILILLTVFIFNGAAGVFAQKIEAEPPPIKAKTLDGETFELAAHKGKVVYVVLWATWCGYCAKYLPQVESEIWKKYRRDKNFQMVTIAVDDDAETLKTHAAKKGYTFPIIADKNREIFNSFGFAGVPMSFVINDEGSIVLARTGYSPSGFERVHSVIKQEIANAAQKAEQKKSKTAETSAKPLKPAVQLRSSNRLQLIQ